MPAPTPDTPILKAMAMRELECLRAQLRTVQEVRMRELRGEGWLLHCEECAHKIDGMVSALAKIPDETPSQQALAQVLSCLAPLDSLRKTLSKIESACSVTTDDERYDEPLTPVKVRYHLMGGQPIMPCASVDRVHFSVTTPPLMSIKNSYVVDVWAHLESQRGCVIERACEEAGTPGVRIKSKGPVRVERGTVLTVQLRIHDMIINPVEDTILWEGEIGNATFTVTPEFSATPGAKSGLAPIYAHGFQIASVSFTVQIGSESIAGMPVPAVEKRLRTAFASYATPDQDAVLVRVQGLRKALPGLSIFFARKDLKSGDKWKQELAREIATRDVMYLFWSKAASVSEWVEWEWRKALATHGIDFINPFPLVSPELVPPPKELADELHFSDWELAYMRTSPES